MTLVLLSQDVQPQVVVREPEGVARREDVLRDLLFAHPDMLPVADIDPTYGRLVPVARELVIPDVGRIDALLVDEHGRLVVVEAKLWRNPQARREVVGQILDYARELARFSYDDLQRQVSAATGRPGNVLYELACQSCGPLDEARFVDQVSRNLARGRFLLMIVGDGITEGTQRIGEFLSRNAGLAFDFAMVEMAHYRFTDPGSGSERSIIQPRVIARTVLLERTIIRNEASGIALADVRDEVPATSPPRAGGGTPVSSEAHAEWRAFVERFQSSVRFDDPGQEPPRHGGLNWMRLPLPGPAGITLWRSKPDQVVGGFATFRGSEGFALYDLLAEERASIDQELVDAGLPAPVWERGSDKATIDLRWPSPQPWTEVEQERQAGLLGQAANALVNALRPRLLSLVA